MRVVLENSMMNFLKQFAIVDKKKNRMIIYDRVLDEHDMNHPKELYKHKARHYKKLKGGESGWSMPIIPEDSPKKKSSYYEFDIDDEYKEFLKAYRPLYTN